jgi:hypothetical protein
MPIPSSLLEISCRICKKPIKDGQRYRGIGKARRTKSTDVILDIANVKCWCHTKCLQKTFKDGQKENPAEIVGKVLAALATVGENPNQDEVAEFIKELQDKKEDLVSEVVREWISAKTV